MPLGTEQKPKDAQESKNRLQEPDTEESLDENQSGEDTSFEEGGSKLDVSPEATARADIQTGADTLLRFLENKSKFSVSDIANNLDIPEKNIKRWGKALDEAGYVKISYSAIKGMVLEYDSEKSYEELNVGRSEFPRDLDEIEIEEEKIEEASEESREITQEENQKSKDVETHNQVEQTQEQEETQTRPRHSEENFSRKSDSAVAGVTPIDELGYRNLDSDLGGHGEKLLFLGRALKNPNRDNDSVYDEINSEFNGLKDYIMNNNLDDQDLKAIYMVMEKLKEDFESATEEGSETSMFSATTNKIKSFWKEHRPVKKVDE